MLETAGFAGARVSQVLLLGILAGSLAASVLSCRHYLHLQLEPHVLRHHQLWRLLTWGLFIPDSAELLLATVIAYQILPSLERRMGSRKFLAEVVLKTYLTHCVVQALGLLALISIVNFLANTVPFVRFPASLRIGIAAGPTPMVVSIFCWWVTLFPGSSTFQFGKSVQVTEAAWLGCTVTVLVLASSRNLAPNALALLTAALRLKYTERSAWTGSERRWQRRVRRALSLRTLSPSWLRLSATTPSRTSRAERPRLADALGRAAHDSADPTGEIVRRAPARAADGMPAPHVEALARRQRLQFFPAATSSASNPLSSQASTLRGAFPTVPQDRILHALQESNGDLLQAVQRLSSA